MARHLSALLVLTAAVFCFGQGPQPVHKLPKPHYHPKDSDPAWLGQAVQFHGHLGPWATAGVRLGMAALGAVEAGGYFDVEVTCRGPFAKPPRSCFLDGLQVGTGATLGKRNLQWVEADEVAVRVKNTRTGREAEVRPTPKLLELLSSLKSRPKAQGDEDHDHAAGQQADDPVEALARKIAAMPDEEIILSTKL